MLQSIADALQRLLFGTVGQIQIAEHLNQHLLPVLAAQLRRTQALLPVLQRIDKSHQFAQPFGFVAFGGQHRKIAAKIVVAIGQHQAQQ